MTTVTSAGPGRPPERSPTPARLSIRWKLVIAFLLVSLVPLGAITIWNTLQARQTMLAVADQLLLSNVADSVATIETYLQERRLDAQRMALGPVLLPFTMKGNDLSEHERRQIERGFESHRRAYGYLRVALVQEDGAPVVTVGDPIPTKGSYSQVALHESLGGVAAISDPFFAGPDGPYVFEVAAPVRDLAGVVRGGILLALSFENITNILKADLARSGPVRAGVLLDEHTIRIAHASDPGLVGRPIIPLPSGLTDGHVRIARFGRNTAETLRAPQGSPALAQQITALRREPKSSPFFEDTPTETQTRSRGVIALFRTKPWAYAISVPNDVFLAPARAQAIRSAIVFALATVVAGCSAWALGGLAARRLARLAGTTELLATGDFAARAYPGPTDEIGRVAHSFNAMAAALQEHETANRDRVARLEALTAMGRILTATTDLHRAVSLVVEKSMEILGADAAAFLPLDPQDGSLRITEARGLPPSYVSTFRLEPGQGMSSEALHTGLPVLSSDVLADSRFPLRETHRELLRGAALRAVLVVPIRLPSGPYGVLALYRREPRPFEAHEVHLATIVASEAGTAIENARLFEQERSRREQLEAVRTVTAEITRELDLAALLGLISRRVADLVGTPSSTVYLWDEASQVLLPRAWHGIGDWVRDVRLRLGEGATGVVAQRREGIIVNDYASWEFASPLILERTGATAILAEPLLYRDRLLGVIMLNDMGTGRPFTVQDRDLLGLFAAAAAIAIENARLFHEEQERRRQFEAVRAVSEEIARELDLVTLLRLITRSAVELAGTTSGAVFLWDEAGQVLVPGAWHGHGAWLGELSIAPGEGVLGLVVQRREGIIVNDYRNWPLANRSALERSGITAVVAEPLLYRDRFLGVISISDQGTGRAFTERDRETLALFARQAAIAIENAGLFQREQERRRQLEAVRVVAGEVLRELDLGALLQLIHRRAADLVGAASGTVWLWDEARKALAPAAWHGHGEWFAQVRLQLGEGVAGVVAQGLKGLIVNDYQSSHYAMSIFLERSGVVATLSEPLMYRDRLLGVLTLSHHAQGQRFSEADRDLVALFAGQAAIAIENARLLADSQGKAREATALADVGRAANTTLDLDEVLSLVVARSVDVMAVDAAAIHVADPFQGTLRISKGHGLSDGYLAALGAARMEGVAGMAFRDGQPAWTPDVLADPRFRLSQTRRSSLASEGLRAILAVPIRTPSGPYGVLALYRRVVQAFEPDQIRFGSMLADQAGIAIENARLFQQELERRQQLEAVRAVSEEIIKELDLRVLLELITRRAAELVGAPSGTLYLWDEATEVLRAHAWHGIGEWVAEVPLRLGEGTAGVIAQRREGVIINDYQNWPYASPIFQERTGTTATLGEPLLYRDRLLGVIVINNLGTGRRFTPQDRQILALFAAQAAIAIENARLYQESERRAREATALAEVGKVLSASLDVDRVLDLIVQEVQQVMAAPFVGIMTLDDERKELSYSKTVGLSLERVALVRTKVGQGIAGEAVQKGVPLQSPNLLDDPRFVPLGYPEAEGFRSLLCVPLRAGGRSLGVILLFRREEHTFSPSEVQLLTNFSDRAALALENARLHEHRFAQMVALSEALKRLVIAQPLETFFRDLVEVARQAVGARYGALAILGPDGSLAQVVPVGLTPQEMERIGPLPQGKGLLGHMLRSAETLRLEDLTQHPEFSGFPADHPPMRTLLGTRIVFQDRVIGTLYLAEKIGGPFDADDERLVEAFAANVAVAVANAQAYQEVQEARRALEAKTKELEAFTYTISHDLKAPLRGIDGFSRALEEDYGDRLEDQGRHYLEMVRAAAHRMDTLIEDLLKYSRLERRGLQVRRVDLASLCNLILEDRQRQIQARGVEVRLHLDAPHVEAEPEGLREAVANLVDNAIKFSKPGGAITIASTVVDRLPRGSDGPSGKSELLGAAASGGSVPYVIVTVQDEGIGFDMRYHDRIFEIFHRLHRVEDFEGTGVGLAIVKKVAERHGGCAWAESAPGRGSTFSLAIPNHKGDRR